MWGTTISVGALKVVWEHENLCGSTKSSVGALTEGGADSNAGVAVADPQLSTRHLLSSTANNNNNLIIQ